MIGVTLPSCMYLSTRPTDMRKSIDGLGGEVQNYLGQDPADSSLFIFFNRRRDKVKMLWWDRDGFWVLYKRLESGTFQMPPFENMRSGISLSADQLQLILAGIDLNSVRHRKRYRLAS
jgi:transposase